MKIGLLRRGYSRTGGAEAYLKRFAEELARQGHHCTLLATGDWPEEDWQGEINRIRGRTLSDYAEGCMKLRSDYDLFFSLERIPGCDVFRAGDGVHKAWLKRRSVFDPAWKRWSYAVNPKHTEILNLEKQMFEDNPARLVIANSQMVKEEIIACYNFPAERISVVYNGLPPRNSQPNVEKAELRRQLNLPADKTLVLFAGSGWPRKGLRFAVRAANQFQKMHLIVAGRGDTSEFESSNVQFLGPLTDVSPAYAACDLFLLPTIYDPFSNACLEAAASGLPVITTKANGFSEVITPGEHGEILSRPDAIDEIVQALERWNDADRRNQAREKILSMASRFTIQRNTEETLALIRDLF